MLKTPSAVYIGVYVVLMLLLAATIAVAYLDLGLLNDLLALTIATVKGILIILFFMHVRHSSRLVQIFVVGGFLWLLIMVLLTMTDYIWRTLV